MPLIFGTWKFQTAKPEQRKCAELQLENFAIDIITFENLLLLLLLLLLIFLLGPTSCILWLRFKGKELAYINVQLKDVFFRSQMDQFMAVMYCERREDLEK